MEQKFGILGGGISGLSTAYYLRKKFPGCAISLFEKEAKLGGWLQTYNQKFEMGARLIKNDQNSQGFHEMA